VLGSVERFSGRVIRVVTDTVALPSGDVVERDLVRHPGAVGVVALDDRGRIAMVEQYRHPVAQRLQELPAGLLDVEGERAYVGAARELVEEAGIVATEWQVLVDVLTSPGMTDEASRIFLARGLRAVDRPPGHAEEADIALSWVGLEDAVARVLAGDIRNAMACVGILAASRAAADGFVGLRPADAPWPDRPGR
jgi:ADP-ribose pyrophosphatase